MKKQATYGLPLNPASLLNQLKGASFCVSYATREKLGNQLEQAIGLVGKNRILLIDNGAYSHWNKARKQGGSGEMTEDYVEGFETWAQDILDRCPQAVAVIPDVIGGTVEQNMELLQTSQLDADRCMAIWHLHEPIEYLLYLCESYNYVGFGSTADAPGTPAWHARIREAFAAIDKWEAEGDGAYIRPRLHMMRAQAFAHLYPFDTSDSTNVAMNHNRWNRSHPGENHVARLATHASAKIRASSGAESEHQIKRPLLDHLETAAWRACMLLEAAGYRVTKQDDVTSNIQLAA